MSLNENWQNQVENELRNLKDYSIAQSINQLALQSQLNYQLPSRIGQTSSNADDPFSSGEIIWIRMTGKQTVNGQIYYAWRRQVKLATGNGFIWVDSGDSGTLDYHPASGVNNEDVSIVDGKRYPAKWNPDTSQWIFFLRNYTPPPSSGTNYGIKTWVVWKDRSSLPALANPLADDLERQRVTSGGLIYYGTQDYNVSGDHGKVCAYTRLVYDRYDTFRVGQFTYLKPNSQSRSIPGVGAYDMSTAKSYFLYADPSILSNSYGVSTYVASPAPGSLVLNDVKFHFDDSHGANIYSNVATGDIYFEWPFTPSATNLQIRMTPDSAFPGRPTAWPSGYDPFTVSELQLAWDSLKNWTTCNYLDPSYANMIANYSVNGISNKSGNVELAWNMNTWKLTSSVNITGKGQLQATLSWLEVGPRKSSNWYQNGDYFPGGKNGYGYFKAYTSSDLSAYNVVYSLRADINNFYSNMINPVGVEIQWS